MRVGWVGAGKLGLPCALVLDKAGHEVTVHDSNPAVAGYLADRQVPYLEDGVPGLLTGHTVTWADSVDRVVGAADVVFVAVQTPHQPRFDGTHLLDDDRADFEYAYLIQAVRQVAAAAQARRVHRTVVVVSTVLPGTFNRHLRPLANDYVSLIYNPFFIAMGTTAHDFSHPEFVLCGADHAADLEPLERLYATVHEDDVFRCSIETAELTKVAYNTFIGLKVAFGNLMGELCHKTGADVDDLVDALAHGTDRIVSTRYMRAGMGDGGGCHPRDNLALSHVAREHGLHYDLFSALMEAREAHSGWLASLVDHWRGLTGLPVWIMGRAYKPGTNLTVGSPATLLHRQIGDASAYDPRIDPPGHKPTAPAVYFIATAHPEFVLWPWPEGSVVLDPHGIVPDRDGVTVVRIGRKR
jgi:UDPglucose 6-dehydrogenase